MNKDQNKVRCERKSKSRVLNEQKDQYDEEDLTECVKCGTFVSKIEKKRCTICTNAYKK